MWQEIEGTKENKINMIIKKSGEKEKVFQKKK